MPPSPEQLARAQRLLDSPNIPESEKAALRAKLGMGGEKPVKIGPNQAKFLANPEWPQSYKDSLVRHLADGGQPASAPAVGGVRIGEAQNIRGGAPPTEEPNDSEPDRDVDDLGGGGATAPGASGDDDPYLKMAARPEAKPATGLPGPSPSASGADQVLGYLRSGLHGLDRAALGGSITNAVDALSPGFRASGESAARQNPTAEAAGIAVGGLMPWRPHADAAAAAMDNPVLRAGAHGLDRSMTFGLGTTLGDVVSPGLRARGEAAASRYPVAEVLGMLGGSLLPISAASQAGTLGAGIAERVIPGVASPGLWGGVARTAAGAAGGALSSAVQDAGEDVAAGRPIEGAGRAALAGGVVGGALSGAGEVARGVQNAIRDPADQVGRDIASAKNIGGETHWLKGVEKGPVYEGAEREARAAAQAGRPISPSGVAEQRAVPELGRSVQADIDARLGKMGAENAQVGDEMVSLQPVLDKSLGRLRRMMRDQKPLPGMSTRGLADTVKKSADVQLVDVTDSALDSVDPENILEAGEAAAMGLIPKGSNLQGKAVILTPRQVSPRELEDIRGAYDSAGKVSPQNIKAAGEVENARAVAGAAREARIQLGPEAIDRAARHEKSLGEMENVIHAARLPAGARKVDLKDLATQERLGGALRGYRTRGNEAADQVLDQLAGRGPLRGALDESAGVSAIERMRREASIPMNASGIGNYGLKDAAKLRADALLRYLENGVGATARPVGRGLIPASVSAAQPTRRQP